LRLRTRLPPEQITVSRAPGQPDLYTIKLRSGLRLQTYLDSAKPGPSTVHFTFFRASGQEEPITSATATAITPAGAGQPLKLIRSPSGHSAATRPLPPGRWPFGIAAAPAGGPPLSGYFSQTVRP